MPELFAPSTPHFFDADDMTRMLPVPFLCATGHDLLSQHHWQVAIYGLMLRDYGNQVAEMEKEGL